MTYTEATHWLIEELPFFQQQGATAYRPGLERITSLCSALGNPQSQLKTIHIAGTNGKGSTAHMLAAIFQNHGWKVGLHTSPHLLDFGERNRINGKNTDKFFVTNFIAQHQSLIKELGCSYFEVAVALGLSYFATQKVDIAIIETGLGGRFDATNIIKPELSIITNIALEHTAILGNTLAKIAYEKGGIIKEEVPVIIGESNEDTLPIFKEIAEEKNALLYAVKFNEAPLFKTDLKGLYQKKNIKIIEKAIEVLRLKGITLSHEKIEQALKQTAKVTGLRGRWETLSTTPLVVADTAHNPAGIQEVVQQINNLPLQSKHLVLGFVKDKAIDEILALLPQGEDFHYYFTQPGTERQFPIEALQKKVPQGLSSQFFPSVIEALNVAKKDCPEEGFIFIGGSNFVVAEVLANLA